MGEARHIQRIVDACVGMGRYQPHELLRWLVADVLAGFGVHIEDRGPEDLLAWLRDTAGEYARAVAAAPFEDVLGHVYQALAARGHRGSLGQFFTPGPVAEFMARMCGPGQLPDPTEPNRLLRMCEPACGSGALVLGFMRSVQESQGAQGLMRWSITGVDLDHLCAHICAAQVLSNLFVGRLSLGELVVYRGNALAPVECLSVVVHASLPNLSPDVVLPALHPSRLFALREAAAAASRPPVFSGAAVHEECTDHEGKPAAADVQLTSEGACRRRAAGQAVMTPVAADAQADLFGE